VVAQAFDIVAIACEQGAKKTAEMVHTLNEIGTLDFD
jgi:hypothetical protein